MTEARKIAEALRELVPEYRGVRLLSADAIASVQTYREAVRLCWQQRVRVNMTARTLAEEAGLYASHVSNYLSADVSKRDLPAAHITAFERVCGNRAITQWLVFQANLTILEQFVDSGRRAA